MVRVCDFVRAFYTYSCVAVLLFAGAFSPQQSDAATLGVDFVVIMDESASLAGDQQWVGDAIAALESSLKAAGITNNRYGLTGFGGEDGPGAHVHNVGSGLWGTATEFDTAMTGVSASGSGPEDGLQAINFVMDTYDFRSWDDGYTTMFFLVTDEPRSVLDGSLTFEGTAERLSDNNVLLNLGGDVNISGDPTGQFFDPGLVVFKTGGGIFSANGQLGFGSASYDVAAAYQPYVDLAFGTGSVSLFDVRQSGDPLLVDAFAWTKTQEALLFGAPAPTVVPLPAGLPLLLAALVGLGLLGGRASRSAQLA